MNENYEYYENYENEAVEVIEDNNVDKLDAALSIVDKVPILKGLVKDVHLLVDMVKDYMHGNYRKIPSKTIFLIVGAILYLINPVDVISDLLPVIGFTDDLAFLAGILKSLSNDIDEYKEWKEGNEI